MKKRKNKKEGDENCLKSTELRWSEYEVCKIPVGIQGVREVPILLFLTH